MKKLVLILWASICASLLVTGCAQQPNQSETAKLAADIVLNNGVVYTLDSNQPWAEAVAIKDGKILDIGSHRDWIKHISKCKTV